MSYKTREHFHGVKSYVAVHSVNEHSARLKDQEALSMKTSSRNSSNSRSPRRSRRKGPIHFALGLFLETLGFSALIAAMSGLGRENWFLELITSPATETSTNFPAANGPSVISQLPQPGSQFAEGTAINSWSSPIEPPVLTRSTRPFASSNPTTSYLGHNSPWTSHH